MWPNLFGVSYSMMWRPLSLVMLLVVAGVGAMVRGGHNQRTIMADIAPPPQQLDLQTQQRAPLPLVWYSAPLDGGAMTLLWRVDYSRLLVDFKLQWKSSHMDKFKWLAIGWSDRGEVTDADFCLAVIGENELITMLDLYTDSTSSLHKDQQQDCLNFEYNHQDQYIFFSRELNTCDVHDYVFEEGTTHILWVRSEMMKGTSMNNISASNKGMVRVQLLKPLQAPKPPLREVQELLVHMDHLRVPEQETTYWCKVVRTPSWLVKQKHHIVQFEARISVASQGLVHHMEVFYCDLPASQEVPAYSGLCDKRPTLVQACRNVKAAWAMGAAPFRYPKAAGMPIGGPQANAYIMLEVHYNNVKRVAGLLDSSGVAITLTSRLRRYDAAIMELGLEYTDKMVMPPKQERAQLEGYCVAECTKAGLPANGIMVFGSQLHTHLTGLAVRTRHFRAGVELPLLNSDNHYSTHFQEIRMLKKPIHILPGDFLITTCDDTTLHSPNMTYGGEAITDEMCLNYIHYYPATQLELCKSSISSQALDAYFQFEQQMDGMNIHQNMTIREKFNQIYPWTPLRVEMFKDLYNKAPLSVQCNSSDGSRFPGVWDNYAKDVVYLEQPKKRSVCEGNPKRKEKVNEETGDWEKAQQEGNEFDVTK